LGKLIVFEGIDGSGKTTQFRLMCERFADEGVEFKRLTFPRYEEPSSALIKMYLGGEFGDDPDAVNAYAASSFYAVDRFASFIQDWGRFYEDGGLVLTDRYTTSNALHQGAKMPPEQRERFFKWLYKYEFDLLGLPEPDLVVFMDIKAEYASRRLQRRQFDTGTVGDIHEKDGSYLEKCALAGEHAAELYGWLKVACVDGDKDRSEDEIHQEVYNKISNILCQAKSFNSVSTEVGDMLTTC